MNNEIKEILEQLKQHISIVSIEDEDLLLDYITNLQEENIHLDKVNCQLRKKINNDTYKSRNEKAIEYCNKEIGNIIAYFDYVDTKDLENVRKILQGEDNTPENLYKYTPEKGFRLVGDDNE